MAENSGDVYFYSPELLDGTKFGIPNQRNLYVAHPDGTVQLVATMDVGTEVNRMTDLAGRQVRRVPDQVEADLVRQPRLRRDLPYDSQTDTVNCASCRPEGPPTQGRDRQPGREIHVRRRPRLLRHQGLARPAGQKRRSHRRLRVRRRAAAADQRRPWPRVTSPAASEVLGLFARPETHGSRGGQPRRHGRLLLDLRNPRRRRPQRPIRQVLRRPHGRRLPATTRVRALCRRRRVPRRRTARRRRRRRSTSAANLGASGNVDSGEEAEEEAQEEAKHKKKKAPKRSAPQSTRKRHHAVGEPTSAADEVAIARACARAPCAGRPRRDVAVGASAYENDEPGFTTSKWHPSDDPGGRSPGRQHRSLESDQRQTEPGSGGAVNCLTLPHGSRSTGPSGFIGNPHVTPKCTLTEFSSADLPGRLADRHGSIPQLRRTSASSSRSTTWRRAPNQAGLLGFTAPLIAASRSSSNSRAGPIATTGSTRSARRRSGCRSTTSKPTSGASRPIRNTTTHPLRHAAHRPRRPVLRATSIKAARRAPFGSETFAKSTIPASAVPAEPDDLRRRTRRSPATSNTTAAKSASETTLAGDDRLQAGQLLAEHPGQADDGARRHRLGTRH